MGGECLLIRYLFCKRSVDDAVMNKIASKMADSYLDFAFWADLQTIAEHVGVPRKK